MIDWWGDPTAVTSVGRRHGFRDAGASGRVMDCISQRLLGCTPWRCPDPRAGSATDYGPGWRVAVALLLGAELVSEQPD